MAKTNRTIAFLKLTRIEHSVMLAIAVIVAEIIAYSGIPKIPIILLSIIPPILISMGAFSINDYYDVEIDKRNHKNGPLVNGSLKPITALYVTVITFVFGIAITVFINVAAFAIALIFAALAYLYSYKLKRIPLLGNIYIAFTMVIPFIYGVYVITYAFPFSVLLICLVVFLSGLARELHGMVRDYEGDVLEGRIKNVVFLIGKPRASQFAFILYMEAIIISIFMFFFIEPFRFNIAYIIPIIITDILLAYVSAGFILSKSTKRFYSLSRNLSLGAMLLAIIAYLMASLFYVAI